MAQIRRLPTNSGRQIKEGILEGIEAATRDIKAKGKSASRKEKQVVNKLRDALSVFRSNSAGLCKQLALQLLEAHGGWDGGEADGEASALSSRPPPPPPPHNGVNGDGDGVSADPSSHEGSCLLYTSDAADE